MIIITSLSLSLEEIRVIILPNKMERQSLRLKHIFFRKEIKSLTNGEKDKNTDKCKYYQMKMSWDQTLDIKDRIKEKISENNPDLKSIKIRNLNLNTDINDFIRVYNRSFITSPDPYRTLTIEDIKHFDANSTFIAILYGKIVGFIFVTIEPLIKKGKEIGKTGCIAGIGVDPRYRRRGIAFVLAARAADYFAENDVLELVCEIYYRNKVSYNFIQNFGFIKTGIIYI